MSNSNDPFNGWTARGGWDWDLAEVPYGTQEFEEEGSVDDDFEDDDEDEFEEAIANCSMGRNGLCGKAGSEECDWECPFSR